jgi:hypothetical protein
VGEGVGEGEVLGVGVTVGLGVGEGEGDGVGEGEVLGEFVAYITYTATDEIKQAHTNKMINTLLLIVHSNWSKQLIIFFQYFILRQNKQLTSVNSNKTLFLK